MLTARLHDAYIFAFSRRASNVDCNIDSLATSSLLSQAAILYIDWQAVDVS